MDDNDEDDDVDVEGSTLTPLRSLDVGTTSPTSTTTTAVDAAAAATADVEAIESHLRADWDFVEIAFATIPRAGRRNIDEEDDNQVMIPYR